MSFPTINSTPPRCSTPPVRVPLPGLSLPVTPILHSLVSSDVPTSHSVVSPMPSVRPNRRSVLSRTLPASEAATFEASLEEFITSLQEKQEWYCNELGALRAQISSMHYEFSRKEAAALALAREATTDKQILAAEVAVLSDSQQKLLRFNAELEERLSAYLVQLGELSERNEFLECERLQESAPVPFSIEDLCSITVIKAQNDIKDKSLVKISAELESKSLELKAALLEISSLSTHLEEALAKIAALSIERNHLTENLNSRDSEIDRLNVEIKDGERAASEREAFVEKQLAEFDEKIHTASTVLAAEQTARDSEFSKMNSLILEERQKVEELISKISDFQQSAIDQNLEISSLNSQIHQLTKKISDSEKAQMAMETDGAHLRAELKTSAQRLKAALEEQERLIERCEHAESLLSSEQKNKVPNRRRSKGKQPETERSEIRKYQLENAELRMRIIDLQQGVDENQMSPRNEPVKHQSPQMTQTKRARTSLDQEECRQQ